MLQVIDEETNILTRVCPWYDSEEIYHSNLALAEKHIGKFYCSSDKDDAMQFIVDVSTFYITLKGRWTKERISKPIISLDRNRYTDS